MRGRGKSSRVGCQALKRVQKAKVFNAALKRCFTQHGTWESWNSRGPSTPLRMTDIYFGGAVISIAQIAAGRMYMDAR